MKKQNKSIFFISLIAALVTVIVWDSFDLESATVRLESLSHQGIGYKSQAVELLDSEKEIFGQLDFNRRFYHTNNGSFIVTLIDGTKDRHAVHDPMYCFTGAGWEHSEIKNKASYKHIRLTKNKSSIEVIYYFSNSNEIYSTKQRYLFDCSLRRLSLGWSGKEPILVVIQSIENQSLNWHDIIKVLPELQSI